MTELYNSLPFLFCCPCTSITCPFFFFLSFFFCFYNMFPFKSTFSFAFVLHVRLILLLLHIFHAFHFSVFISHSLSIAYLCWTHILFNYSLLPSLHNKLRALTFVSLCCASSLISVGRICYVCGWGYSSGGGPSDRHAADAGSIPRCGKGFFF